MTEPKRNPKPPQNFQTVGAAHVEPSYAIALDLFVIGVIVGAALAAFLS